MSSSHAFDHRLSGLIGRFYDAAADNALWAGMADDVAGSLESTSAVLKLHGADDTVQLLESTVNLHVSDRQQSWATHWHRQDLWVERAASFGVSRVVTDHDLVSPIEQRKSGFYQEWLRELDIHHMIGAVFPGGNGALGVLGVHRPERAGAYDDTDRHKVSILLPHLQRAIWLGQQLAITAARQAVTEEVLARIDAGVFAVDVRCRIMSLNAGGEALLDGASGLAVSHGRLRLQDGLLDQCMTQMVQTSVSTASGHPVPPGAAMVVPRDGRLPLTMIVTPLRPSGIGTQTQPLALVIVRDPEAATLSTTGLRELFGFTRSEAVIARDLASGLSLDDVAEQRGIGAATARSHLKRILSKTNTHRQAEAVALIARSVAALDQRT